MGNEYLCYLIFIFFKFIFKNFICLEIVYDTMMLSNIFLQKNIHFIPILKFLFEMSPL